MELITPLLHGLAIFGVYILNVIIYETIAIILWLAIALPLYCSSIPERVSDNIVQKSGAVLAIVFLAFCVLYLFGIGRIVPLPKF